MPSGVLRGAGPLLLARITSGVATVGMFAGVARVLSVEDVGLFAVAWSTAYILGSIAEGGYGMVVIREVSQRPREVGRYLGALIPIRSVVLLPTVLGGALIGWVVLGADEAPVVGLAALAAYLQLTAQTGRDFLIPGGAFGTVATLAIAENVVRVLTVVWAAASTGSVLMAFAAAAATHAASAAATFVVIHRRLRPRAVVAGIDAWRTVARSTLSFSLFITLTALYLHVHSVVASALLSLASAAMVQIALRLFFSAEYLPEAVARWAYPHLSRDATVPGARFPTLATAVAGRLVLLGVGVAVLLMVAAPWIVPALFGREYVDAVALVQLAAIAIPLRFASHAYGTSLSAGGRQVPRVTVAALAISITVVCEVILAELIGVRGIMLSLALGSAVLVIGYWVALRRSWHDSISAAPILVALGSSAAIGTALLWVSR